MSTSLCWPFVFFRYPRAKLSTKFQDSGVYVCKHSVLDAVSAKSDFESFREEFFPWLCKLQYQKTKREKYGRIFASTSSPQALALKHSTLHTDGQKEVENEEAPGSPEDQEHLPLTASLRIGLVLHRLSEGPAARVNNFASYLEMNRSFLTSTSYVLPSDPKNRSLIDAKAQISPDSLIGDSTKVEERATIKKSIVGKHCTIGKMAKVVACILLDHCVIADGAKLEGCILGKNTKVGSKADLSKCITQAGYEVDPNETLKNEKLDVSDWSAAPPPASDDEADEDEDEDDDE